MKTNTIDFTGDPMLMHAMDGAVTVSIPIRIRRFSGRKQVVVPPGVSAAAIGEAVPTALQIALARGHRWLRQIESGKSANLAAIAKLENIDRSYVSRMINLTTLAPDIQAAILDDTLPDTVSLFDLAVDTPLSWEEQRRQVSKATMMTADPSSTRFGTDLHHLQGHDPFQREPLGLLRGLMAAQSSDTGLEVYS